jgi:2-polyprenyl-3-methyl-5-hydroxy-6-metoxy-1,4-benzoquinol methylase
MSDQFYTSIAPFYQHIFPFNPTQIEFLKYVLPYNGARVLDVGCATGDLAFALTHFGFPTWAFDYDARMIETAQQSKLEDTMFPVFEQLDMRILDQRYPESYFDTIICFGNTLVHLLTDEDILQFLQSAHKTLATDGTLTIQILNYDFILNQGIKSLPVIENEHVRFERNYEFNTTDSLIEFKTRLTIKSTNQVIPNSVQLNPVRKNKLQELMEEAGFGSLEFFGNFAREPLSDQSLPLIVTYRKKLN